MLTEDDLRAWRAQVGVRMFDGGHFYFSPGQRALLEALAGELEEVAAAA